MNQTPTATSTAVPVLDAATAPTLNAAAATAWLGALHGDSPGLLHICATDLWTGRAFPTDAIDAAVAYIAQLDSEGREGIYLRATTLRDVLPTGSRGGEADSLALPGLWADLDIAGPGHKTTQALPPTEAAARHIINESGLPAPTLWIHSGGGLYPWWLLNQPHQINDDLDDLRALSKRWQDVIAAAAQRLGWHYGTGVGDLARVLRIPGTLNRKTSDPQPCRFIDATPVRYSLDNLRDALASAITALPEPEPAPRRLTVVKPADGSIQPGDDFEARVDWADEQLLGGAGWTFAQEKGSTRYWRRPGKDTAGISATTGRDPARDRLFVFSTDALPFEAWKPYTKFSAFAELHHGGDYHTAAKALRANGYGRSTPISGTVAAAEQAEALADLMPATPTPAPAAATLAAVNGTAVRVLAEPAPDPQRYGPTEDGVARALVAHHGHELRYCPQRGKWLRWVGHRWLWDDAELHREHIKALARILPDTGEGFAVFKKRALSANGVTGIARQAQSDPAVTVSLADLDARPYELNTLTGVVDLRTGQLGPPDPAALHTRCTAVAPDFDRQPEAFNAFLADTFGPDADLRDYIQRLLGLSCIGTVLEQLLLFPHGTGANGKSTLLEAVMHALGVGENGYAMAAAAEMLMARNHTEHPVELAQLAGARLVVCSELEDGQRFAEARIKQLTGRDSINARFMRANPFTFTPSHTLWLLGNHKPAASVGGPAFWRRVRLLPFIHVVPEGSRDPRLGEKLTAEAAGILGWIVRGAADYHTDGLREPDSVVKASAAYASDQDTIGRWLDDACHLAAGNTQVRVAMGDVRSAYETWCREAGEEPVSAKRLGMDLRDRFSIGEAKSNGRKFYVGLTLLHTDSDDADDRDRGWVR